MAVLRLKTSDTLDGATFWLARLWCLPAFGGAEYCPAPFPRAEEVRFEGVDRESPFRCATPEQAKAELDIRHEHFGERLAGIVWSDRIYQPLATIGRTD